MNILTKFKNLLVESLKENKKLIIGLYVLFIIVFILSWLLTGDAVSSAISKISTSAPVQGGFSADSAVDLFIHNELGGIVTYVMSIFFAVPAVVGLLYNAVNLGMMGNLFESIVPNGGLRYIVYLIPHGIFEITATVLQSVAGILLFLFIWRFIKSLRSGETQGFSDAFEKNRRVLIQSIVIMIFSTILLLIAAPIEAHLSIPISEFIVGA